MEKSMLNSCVEIQLNISYSRSVLKNEKTSSHSYSPLFIPPHQGVCGNGKSFILENDKISRGGRVFQAGVNFHPFFLIDFQKQNMSG